MKQNGNKIWHIYLCRLSHEWQLLPCVSGIMKSHFQNGFECTIGLFVKCYKDNF